VVVGTNIYRGGGGTGVAVGLGVGVDGVRLGVAVGDGGIVRVGETVWRGDATVEDGAFPARARRRPVARINPNNKRTRTFRLGIGVSLRKDLEPSLFLAV
jgi:hypothetical protein